jgi:WD40 repeat protein
LCVVWAPDGSKLVSGEEYDGYGGCAKIKLWSPTGECLNTLEGHSSAVTCVQFSPTDAQLLVSASNARSHNTICHWDVDSGKQLKKLEGHSWSVTCVQFNPRDAGQLVSGSRDKAIKVWNVSDGKCLQTLTGHSTPAR